MTKKQELLTGVCLLKTDVDVVAAGRRLSKLDRFQVKTTFAIIPKRFSLSRVFTYRELN